MKAAVALNVALPRLLAQTLPTLLAEDAAICSDPCHIEYPTDCSGVTVGVTGFMKEGVDVVYLEDKGGGYLCNLRYKIGVPLTEDRINEVRDAEKGNEDSFTVTGDVNDAPGDVLKRLVNVTKTTCFVSQNKDNEWIGDCENCYVRLGRDCPGATFIRDMHGKLEKSLHELRKVPTTKDGVPVRSSGTGNYSGSYKSGLTTKGKGKNRQIYPMISEQKACLDSLDKDDCVELVSYLCLMPRNLEEPVTRSNVKRQRQGYLLGLLQNFHEFPQRARQEAEHTQEGNLV